MSRRRAEFEHRTSIFEGAYRAWSCLGGIEPNDLETKSLAELDPIANPLESDNRCITGKPIKKQPSSRSRANDSPNASDPENENSNSDDNDIVNSNAGRRIYPYEPLPRSGLAHPYVQAILSPWLGADADKEAIQVGLTTLRTWWQHRRRGESGSAVAALGTDRMQVIVERYVRHFFNLAYSLITTDHEQPPRTLMMKIHALEKSQKKRCKKRSREEGTGKLKAMALNANLTNEFGITSTLPSLAPFANGFSPPGIGNSRENVMSMNLNVDVENQIATTFSDLHTIMNDVPKENNRLTPLAKLYAVAQTQPSASNMDIDGNINTNLNYIRNPNTAQTFQSSAINSGSVPNGFNENGTNGNNNPIAGPTNAYGDPSTTPVVFVSENGDIQISMSIDGITCGHCVKIVETVLRGCHGNKSPIQGLLDAVADKELKRVLIKINKSSNAKRIAFEASRNLAMVGYTASVKEMSTFYSNSGKNVLEKQDKVDLDLLKEAYLAVSSTAATDVFDWSLSCTCPDNGLLSADCARHSQMNTRIFEAFDKHESKLQEFMAGCQQRYGGDCSCGDGCQCKSCMVHQAKKNFAKSTDDNDEILQDENHDLVPASIGAPQRSNCCSGNVVSNTSDCCGSNSKSSNYTGKDNALSSNLSRDTYGRASMLSTGTPFGRAMSALSALSIDWDNIEDFDVELDNSAYSDSNGTAPKQIIITDKDNELIHEGCAMMHGGACNCGPTCVCVGCPIHDPDAAKAPTGLTPHGPSANMNTQYSFGEAGNSNEKKPSRRSSLLCKISRPEGHENFSVTFQI